MNTFSLKNKYSSEFFLENFDAAQKHISPPFKLGQVLIERKDVYDESELKNVFSSHQLKVLKNRGLIWRTFHPINQTIYCWVGEEKKPIDYGFEVRIEAPDEYFNADSKKYLLAIVRKTLAQITDLDDEARIYNNAADDHYDPTLARLEFKGDKLCLWYFNTTCNAEWGVHFNLNKHENWVYKDWG